MGSKAIRRPVKFEGIDSLFGWDTVLKVAWRGIQWLWKKRRSSKRVVSVGFHSRAEMSISRSVQPARDSIPLPKNPTAVQRWDYLLATLKSK